MSNKEKNIIIAVLAVIVLLFVWNLGYRTYPRWNKPDGCDTIWRVDTVEHTIVDTFPWYVERLDTIIFRDTIKITDTVEVLKDYTAIHYYETTWNDSSIFVTNDIAITENKILDQKFTYKITKEPIIINRYSYNKYLYLGGTVSSNPEFSSVGLFWGTGKTFSGLTYSPFSNTVNLTGGFKIFQIK